MKTRVLLGVSILINASLLTAFFVTRQPSTKPAPVSTSTPTAETKASREARTTTSTTVSNEDFDWSSVESDDYREYIAKLRSIGCPEETIRDIIIADVNKLFASRIRALYPAPADFQFWRVEDRARRSEDRDRDAQRRALERERNDLIKELLGIDVEVELARWDGRPSEDDWRYGFLSPEMQEQVRALSNKYRDLERAIFNEGGGWTAERRARFAALRAQREAELAQLLGPADYEQYQLRNSWTARNMRENLSGFQPTEDEFKKIFDLRKGFDDQFAFTRGGDDETLREQRRVAQEQLDNQMRAILGDQRWQEYQIAQDPRSRDMFDFAQRNDLPRSTATTIYNMRRDAENARRAIEANQSLTPEQRSASLAAIAKETLDSLNRTLGADMSQDYIRRDGSWINRLASTQSNDRGDERRWERYDRR